MTEREEVNRTEDNRKERRREPDKAKRSDGEHRNHVLHQINHQKSTMDSKLKGIGEKAKIFRNQRKQTIQTDQSDDCLINKPITKSKLQQPCRNSECRVLSWSVRSSIRSLTAGRQKSRYVSYGTFGTSICLWSSNRQINVCVFP